MTIESPVNTIMDLNVSLPALGDPRSEGDDHIRLLKSVVKGLANGVPGAAPATTVTIAANAITVGSSLMSVLPVTGDASGTINTINSSGLWVGALIVLVPATVGITLTHNTAGAGHIELSGSVDALLATTNDFIMLKKESTYWREVLRSTGALGTAAKRTIGDTSDPMVLDRGLGDNRWLLRDKPSQTIVDGLSQNPRLKLERAGSTGPSILRLEANNGSVDVGSENNVPFRLMQNLTERAQFGLLGGLVVGTPTGGDKGAGFVNAHALYTMGQLQPYVETASYTIPSATPNFDIGLPTGHKWLLLTFDGLRPSTAAFLKLQVSTNGGTSFQTSGYLSVSQVARSNNSQVLDISTTEILLGRAGDEQDNSPSAYGLSGQLLLFRSAGRYMHLSGQFVWRNSARFCIGQVGGTWETSTALVNAIRLVYSAGDISIGRITLQGSLT